MLQILNCFTYLNKFNTFPLPYKVEYSAEYFPVKFLLKVFAAWRRLSVKAEEVCPENRLALRVPWPHLPYSVYRMGIYFIFLRIWRIFRRLWTCFVFSWLHYEDMYIVYIYGARTQRVPCAFFHVSSCDIWVNSGAQCRAAAWLRYILPLWETIKSKY